MCKASFHFKVKFINLFCNLKNKLIIQAKLVLNHSFIKSNDNQTFKCAK